MSTLALQAEMIHAAVAEGDVIALAEPLSFWGGYDPRAGLIIDQHHPQCGESLCGRIALMPGTRGSGGGPAGIAESIRLGTAPAGFVLPARDVTLTVGVVVAAMLYEISVPVAVVEQDVFEALSQWPNMKIQSDGSISPASATGRSI